jgi:hypothetical protein
MGRWIMGVHADIAHRRRKAGTTWPPAKSSLIGIVSQPPNGQEVWTRHLTVVTPDKVKRGTFDDGGDAHEGPE